MNHFQHEAGDSGGVLLVALFYFFSTVTVLKRIFSTSIRVKAAHELFIVQYIQRTDLSPNLEGDVEVHGSTTK